MDDKDKVNKIDDDQQLGEQNPALQPEFDDALYEQINQDAAGQSIVREEENEDTDEGMAA